MSDRKKVLELFKEIFLDKMKSDEKNETYKRYFSKTFNMATLQFYWTAAKSEKGKPGYDKNSSQMYRSHPIDLYLKFCEKHNTEPREHGMVYEFFFPD